MSKPNTELEVASVPKMLNPYLGDHGFSTWKEVTDVTDDVRYLGVVVEGPQVAKEHFRRFASILGSLLAAGAIRKEKLADPIIIPLSDYNGKKRTALFLYTFGSWSREAINGIAGYKMCVEEGGMPGTFPGMGKARPEKPRIEKGSKVELSGYTEEAAECLVSVSGMRSGDILHAQVASDTPQFVVEAFQKVLLAAAAKAFGGEVMVVVTTQPVEMSIVKRDSLQDIVGRLEALEIEVDLARA